MSDLKKIKPDGLPSYYDLMMAFMDLRDGESDHDLENSTGFPMGSKQVQRIISVRKALHDVWLGEMD